MATLSQIRHSFEQTLAPLYDKEEIHALFFIAMEETLGFRRTDYALRLHEEIAGAADQRFADILEGLQKQIPIQHILGKASFYGLTFEVSPDTLIPRPETEELVDLIIQKHRDQGRIKILDVGTGSGCIAISLARHLPEADVHAVDISPGTLEVAGRNAQKIGVDIRFRQVDITLWEDFFTGEDRYDVIVSNPPYVRESERADMARNVLDYEPHTALFVEDKTPLLFYDRIGDFAAEHLRPGGCLYFEINQYLGLETAELIERKGFQEVEILKDINGVDRMLAGKQKSGSNN